MATPDTQTHPGSSEDPHRVTYLIAGGGCAGLSLAYHLVEAGVSEPIRIVDRRHHYVNDRTWCYWSVEPTAFDHLSEHAWPNWTVTDIDGRQTRASSSRFPYRHLRADAFYRHVLGRLAESPNVTIGLGESVQEVVETDRGVRVRTDTADYRAEAVFESVPTGPPVSQRGDITLVQHFHGITLRTDRDCFDPETATLMDFAVTQTDGPRFLYVLPFGPNRALVENTYLSSTPIDLERHRREIAEFLSCRYQLGPEDYRVEEIESGRIPMTTAELPVQVSSRRYRIGLVSGAARPSSGYAFLRIQRQTQALAQAVVDSLAATGPDCSEGSLILPAAGQLASPKYAFFDTIFLQVLHDHPEQAGALFHRMFANAATEPLVRFLSDTSKMLDDWQLIAALPKWPFLVAALRSLPVWPRRVLQQMLPQRRSVATAGTSQVSALSSGLR